MMGRVGWILFVGLGVNSLAYAETFEFTEEPIEDGEPVLIPRYPSAKVSYTDFKELVDTVEAHRASRLVDLDTFLEMAKDPNTIVLDTRSAYRYGRIHIDGAAHLNFSDFNQGSLAEVIPTPETRVLIYCNNNFDGNPIDFVTKVATPASLSPISNDEPAMQILDQERPIMMALNVPTYINLYGYGYRNVYELDELVDVSDPRIQFAGTLIDGSSTAQPTLKSMDSKGSSNEEKSKAWWRR